MVRGLFVVFMIASPCLAQDDVFKLNVNVELIELHVSVVDELDRPVSGLKKEHFRILENQADQPISVFKREDLPISLGLVVDNSRSIEPRKERLDAAVLAFVRKSNPEDETFVVHFDFDARVSRDFTSNIQDLETTLTGVKPFGQTAVYDAVILALDHMEYAKQEKKALLLITDGIDNSSKHTLEEAIERLKRSRVAVYPVGLLSAAEGEKAELDLLKMAEASGGQAYFPENVEQARTMMERVARDLREQYTLGYFSTNRARDGAWRSVRMELHPPIGLPQKLKADYRRGYYGSMNIPDK
jgi:Ca-activated chloride channel family protein